MKYTKKNTRANYKHTTCVASHRIKQVNELIHQQLSEIILKEISTPPGCLITITKVNTTRDLSQARISISVLPEQFQHSTLADLEKKAKALQYALGDILVIRKTPRLQFQLDTTEIEAAHIDALIDKIHKEQ